MISNHMEILRNDSLVDAQRDRLGRFNAEYSVDMHCHCLPGLDDGPADLAEAMRLCEALVADGITVAVATPHQLGRLESQYDVKRIRREVERLNAELDSLGVPLRVVPGGEIRVDARIPSMLDTGDILTIGDKGSHVLIELPPAVYVSPLSLIGALVDKGVTPIIAHPERYAYLADSSEVVAQWLRAGAQLQVTAGSLAGDLGPVPAALAWKWLRSGWVGLVASDVHDTDGRCPAMSAAIEAVAEKMGHAAARRICIENPALVLQGQRVVSRMQLGRGVRR